MKTQDKKQSATENPAQTYHKFCRGRQLDPRTRLAAERYWKWYKKQRGTFESYQAELGLCADCSTLLDPVSALACCNETCCDETCDEPLEIAEWTCPRCGDRAEWRKRCKKCDDNYYRTHVGDDIRARRARRAAQRPAAQREAKRDLELFEEALFCMFGIPAEGPTCTENNCGLPARPGKRTCGIDHNRPRLDPVRKFLGRMRILATLPIKATDRAAYVRGEPPQHKKKEEAWVDLFISVGATRGQAKHWARHFTELVAAIVRGDSARVRQLRDTGPFPQ